MSSRLYDAGVGVQFTPVPWGGGAGHNKPAHPATLRPPAADSQPDDSRIQQAYAQGFAAGEQAAAQRAAELVQPALANLSSIVQELTAARKQLRQAAEASAVELALAVARRILYRELAVDPQAVLALVRHAGDRIHARELQRLRLSPADAALVQEHRAGLHLPPAVEITADSQLAPGSAIFETSRGEMDASVETQLEEIQRGLADLVRRRSR
jgi:flagellar assembly protein FliH